MANDYTNKPLYSKHVCELMRRIDALGRYVGHQTANAHFEYTSDNAAHALKIYGGYFYFLTSREVEVYSFATGAYLSSICSIDDHATEYDESNGEWRHLSFDIYNDEIYIYDEYAENLGLTHKVHVFSTGDAYQRKWTVALSYDSYAAFSAVCVDSAISPTEVYVLHSRYGGYNAEIHVYDSVGIERTTWVLASPPEGYYTKHANDMCRCGDLVLAVTTYAIEAYSTTGVLQWTLDPLSESFGVYGYHWVHAIDATHFLAGHWTPDHLTLTCQLFYCDVSPSSTWYGFLQDTPNNYATCKPDVDGFNIWNRWDRAGTDYIVRNGPYRFAAYDARGNTETLGEDAGATEPKDDDLCDAFDGAGASVDWHHLEDLREAIEAVVWSQRYKNPDTDEPYNWNAGPDADNLYYCAMGDRTKYGATGGAKYDWTRNWTDGAELADKHHYDIDIGEIYECVATLEAAS